MYDGVDLPEEGGRNGAPRRGGVAWYWIVAAVLTIVALVIVGIGP